MYPLYGFHYLYLTIKILKEGLAKAKNTRAFKAWSKFEKMKLNNPDICTALFVCLVNYCAVSSDSVPLSHKLVSVYWKIFTSTKGRGIFDVLAKVVAIFSKRLTDIVSRDVFSTLAIHRNKLVAQRDRSNC